MAEGDFPAAGGPGERSNIAMFAIPLLVERESLWHSLRQGWFLLLGVAVVVRLTLLRTGTGALGSANYAKLTPLRFGSLFLSGAVAITAIVLPGISGSFIPLIAGVYIPTVRAVHSFLRLRMDWFPASAPWASASLRGGALHPRHPHRPVEVPGETVWLILGLMLGSLYAIAGGPASLDPPLPPTDLTTFQLPAFALGAVILLAPECREKPWRGRNTSAAPCRKGKTVMDPDWSMLCWIQDAMACPFLDFLMRKITALGNGGAVWLAAAGGFLCTKRYRGRASPDLPLGAQSHGQADALGGRTLKSRRAREDCGKAAVPAKRSSDPGREAPRRERMPGARAAPGMLPFCPESSRKGRRHLPLTFSSGRITIITTNER